MQINNFNATEEQVADTIARERKSWKTVKGKSEPVWPPHLEKALVQALLQYKVDDPRYVRALGRFPKRNRFISDFIFEQTGVRRSPKQVGSRLQQLKDLTWGKQLLSHAADCSLNPNSNSASGPSESNASDMEIYQEQDDSPDDSPSPISPLALEKPYPYTNDDTSSSSTATLYSKGPSQGSPSVAVQIRRLNVFIPFDPTLAAPPKRDSTMPQPLKCFGGNLALPETVFALDSPPLMLAGVEPSTSFTSQHPVAALTTTTVWVEEGSTGGGRPLRKVHQYSQPLVCTQAPSMDMARIQAFYSFDNVNETHVGHSPDLQAQQELFVYKTQLFEDAVWNTLRWEMAGLSRYTITQEFVCSFDNSPARLGETFLCIAYHFVSTPFSLPLVDHMRHGSTSSSHSSGSPSPGDVGSASLPGPVHSFSYREMQGQIGLQTHASQQALQVPVPHGFYSTSGFVHAPGNIHSGDTGMGNMKYYHDKPQSIRANVVMNPGLGGGYSQGGYVSVRTGLTPAPYAVEFGNLETNIEPNSRLY